jgi:peptidyl-dipeptidase Dcp
MGKKSFRRMEIKQDQMAITGTSDGFISKDCRSGKQKVEAKEIQDLIDSQNGGFKTRVWDWDFTEQVRKAKYDLDESQIKPFRNCYCFRKGVFFCSTKMYGITFKERNDLPVYHPM